MYVSMNRPETEKDFKEATEAVRKQRMYIELVPSSYQSASFKNNFLAARWSKIGNGALRRLDSPRSR